MGTPQASVTPHQVRPTPCAPKAFQTPHETPFGQNGAVTNSVQDLRNRPSPWGLSTNCWHPFWDRAASGGWCSGLHMIRRGFCRGTPASRACHRRDALRGGARSDPLGCTRGLRIRWGAHAAFGSAGVHTRPWDPLGCTRGLRIRWGAHAAFGSAGVHTRPWDPTAPVMHRWCGGGVSWVRDEGGLGRHMGIVGMHCVGGHRVWPGHCLVLLGGGGRGLNCPPPPGGLADPPTHPHQKLFLRKKMKFIKGARTWGSISSTQTFVWPLTSPPSRGVASTSHSAIARLWHRQTRGRGPRRGCCPRPQ